MSRHLTVAVVLAVVVSGCGAPRPLLSEGPAPRAGFSGQVVWSGTGRPVAGALVLVGGTGLTAETDTLGAFAVDAVPPGAYTLVAYAPGAGIAMEPVLVADSLESDVRFVLVPVDPDTGGSNGDPEEELLDLRREVRRLHEELRQARRQLLGPSKEVDLFERFFLGSDDRGDCLLRNPDALTFDRRGEAGRPDQLDVRAGALLEVENRRLGYRLRVALDRFSLRRVRRDGSYSMTAGAAFGFEPLLPSDPVEAERWRRNRREAYRGSLRHFLVALAAGRTREEGFVVSAGTEVQPSRIYGSSRRFADDLVVDPATYVVPTGQPLTYRLSFSETLKVVYEDRDVVDTRDFTEILPGPQTSWIGLAGRPVAFTSHGHLLDPDGLTVSGYWGVVQVCDMLPRSYAGE